MNYLTELVEGLQDKNTVRACGCMKELERESVLSPAVYGFMNNFAEMLDSPNSYVRTRAITLIAANARWDEEGRVAALLDELLQHIIDEKPITSRQCIKALPLIAESRPELRSAIVEALRAADPSGYAESMRPLVEKDIQGALEALARQETR